MNIFLYYIIAYISECVEKSEGVNCIYTHDRSGYIVISNSEILTI